MDVKAKVKVVPLATGSLSINCTIYAFVMRSEGNEKPVLEQFIPRIRMEVRDGKT
ncbi:MAG: hypothetical protein NTU59_01360 [Coprothermobacterota bacterium]|nr:hypothetical protein [Coprothermobacterota bacterium]